MVVMPGAHGPYDRPELEDDRVLRVPEVERPSGVVEIHSPMVGTFYRSPSPEAEPFVGVGSAVEEETVICIIEAMKVMNEIKAECTGQVVEILVENGEPVEYGQPVFLVKTR